MSAAKIALVAVVAVVAKPSAFSPPSSSSKARRRRHAAFVVVGGAGARRWTPEAALSTTTDDEFDPFLRSPLSFGSSSSSASVVSENDDGDLAARRTNFGFLTYAECNVGGGSAAAAAAAEADEILASSEFDPLLSPHVYVNGVDAGLPPPSSSSSSSSSSSGVAAPATTTTPRRRKVGILLIDHGSKRSASNEHIHAVARMYERTLKERNDVVDGGEGATTVVRAAHMEISAPSILDALRDVLVADGVAEVVCVPYFLSPGRHATEDVPNLIAEARDVLGREGLLSRARSAAAGSADDDNDEIPILVSDALGTHLEGMLGAVDNLVERTLNK
jgi:hypothetical protein